MKRADAVQSGRLAPRRDYAVNDLARAINQALECRELRTTPLRHYPFFRARGWHFDFAWPAQLIAADVGNFTVLTPTEKWDSASAQGWRVFRFSPKEVRNGYAIDTLARALAHPSLFR